MNTPPELLYTSSDEWLRRDEGSRCTIGITDYAQDALGEIVYVELPAVGDTFAAGASFGVAESVKAVGDLHTPVGGRVVAVNSAAVDTPTLLNESPYGEGWLIQIETDGEPDVSDLLDAQAYESQHS